MRADDGTKSSVEPGASGPGIRVDYQVDGALNGVDLPIEPQVIWVSDFSEQASKEFSQALHQVQQQPIVPVVIDSFGGDVYSLLAMIAEIDSSDLIIATIVKGKAMSAGSFLAACGTPGYRFCDPEATYMIHEVSSMTWGKVSDLRADTNETDRLNRRLFSLLADRCGQDANYFIDQVHNQKHADWFLSAKQAKRHGLVDHVRLPKLRVSVKVNYGLK